MKRGFHSSALLLLFLFLFLFLLFSSSSTLSAARNIAAGEELEEPSNGSPLTAKELPVDTNESLTLIDEEICRGVEAEGDEEECLKRRMIAEAHLDYIYTQHHKH